MTTSQSFIGDTKREYNEDGTIKQDRTEQEGRIHETSCVSEELSRISQLPLNELMATLNNMTIERQVDAYLCSCQAGLDIAGELLVILSNRLPKDLEYLTARLSKEHVDRRIADLLFIFVFHGVEEIDKVFSKKRDYLTVEELPFSPEVSRFLVSKAEEITNGEARDPLLDYLIAFLPREEAMARQAQREEEEARKKSQK